MAEKRFGSMVMDDTETDAPAIVMLHGLGGTSNTFDTLLDDLAGYRLIRPDLPGAGRSPLKPNIKSLESLSGAVTDALKAARVRTATIVGHSMGTLLAQYMAVSAPHRVKGLILFGALTEPSESARQARAAKAVKEGMAEIAGLIADAGLSEKTKQTIPACHAYVRESLMRQPSAGYAAHCMALAKSTALPPMKIRVPVHLVTGSDDVVAPPAMAKQLHSALPFSTLTVLPGVGHWPTLEAPHECRQAMTEAMATITGVDAEQSNEEPNYG